MTKFKYSPLPLVALEQQRIPHIVPPPTSEQALEHGKAWTSFENLGTSVNRFINRLGSEAFWPAGLEEESEKAARILRSFCSMFDNIALSYND